MCKHDHTFDPEWRATKQMRHASSQALPQRKDVALDLRGGIADESDVWCSAAAHPRPSPAAVGLTHNLTCHRLGFNYKGAGRPNHQVVDITRTTWQLETVDQNEVLRQLTREHLTGPSLARQ